MKILSQLIALYLPQANSLQVMATIGCAVVAPKALLSKMADFRNNRKILKERRKLESDMWAID